MDKSCDIEDWNLILLWTNVCAKCFKYKGRM